MTKRVVPGVVLAGVFCGMALQLRLQGRLWMCACGYVMLWAGDIYSADNSQHIFDPYTLTHVIHGFMFIALVHLLLPALSETWKLVGALTLEALWEVIENSAVVIERYRAGTIAIGYTGDTILNSFGDILACVVGAVVARKLGVVKTLLLAGILEVVLLVFVRDSLLLNIIMLIYPLESLRSWQGGR
jgi:hypothetical protein